MGLWGLFSTKKKNDQKIDNNSSVPADGKRMTKGIIKLGNHTDRINYIKENCEIIAESSRQMEEAKVEYQAVTSYLTDMQKIDMLPPELRDRVEDAARKIINLNKERGKFQQKNSKLTDRQYHLLERYELQIPKDLPSIKEGEKYQEMIQKDMKYLEKEKRNLNKEQEDIINKQSFLKGIAITTCIVVILLFIIFGLLTSYSKGNFTIPFLLTVLMAMASSLYIFMEARKNFYDIKLVQMKLSRQVMLMNKVKIKAVNNRSYLDYTYSKYMVESYQELKSFWEEYVKIKDEMKRYQSNTELLEFYHNELIQTLQNFGIADSEIWIYQPSAIIDNKEMVEVRHRLNVRRQKLRERIDIYMKQKDEAISSIQDTMKAYPDCREEGEKWLRKYSIELD